MSLERRVILIGGTSHVGKSTVAARLAERLGWALASTDKLGRHPGRPWRTAPDFVPVHVAAHFLSLTLDEQMVSVLAYYRGLQPTIEALVREHLAAGQGLVLEGSALFPDLVGGLGLPGVQAVWLTAPAAMIEDRMRSESGYAGAGARGRALIDRFLARTLRYDAVMMAAVRRLALPWVDVSRPASVEPLADAVLRAAGPLQFPRQH